MRSDRIGWDEKRVIHQDLLSGCGAGKAGSTAASILVSIADPSAESDAVVETLSVFAVEAPGVECLELLQ